MMRQIFTVTIVADFIIVEDTIKLLVWNFAKRLVEEEMDLNIESILVRKSEE